MIVNKNLVDSNMFIRSLVLSLEHFINIPPVYEGELVICISMIEIFV